MFANKLYEACITYFKQKYPTAKTELIYNSPYQLLVSVILSAQCTDKRVNLVTPNFFKSFDSIEKLSEARVEDVFEKIKSISYPNNKAKYLVSMALMLKEKFSSKIPSNTEHLMLLPGVGRKTANVLTSILFGQATMAVDTHVFRVSRRLGLVAKNDNTVFKVEKKLVKKLPKNIIPMAHHWLILHGRYICKARLPLCFKCELNKVCSYNLKEN